jgi:methenyltetrahydromethanopterin cyclohydrolase
MKSAVHEELQLNRRASELVATIVARKVELRISEHRLSCGAHVLDFGVEAAGGLEAGRLLAEVCLAGLGSVDFGPSPREIWPGLGVRVRTDLPAAACMAAQYAGWQIAAGKFFAMGSGPMRAAAGREELFADIGYTERSDCAVGALETRKLPPDEVARELAEKCHVKPGRLALLVAPTASIAGTVQVVARSVETALHKLHTLRFPVDRVITGAGEAPLPPVARDDLAAIGRTNDAILYGGEVTLWVHCDDAEIEQIGPSVASCSSADYGRPFGEIFQRYDGDFYKIDPHLFSPAVVTFVNLASGNSFRFGRIAADILAESFDTKSYATPAERAVSLGSEG